MDASNIITPALSRGELQAIGATTLNAVSYTHLLARALAQEAHVLLLDEPFTGLDAPACQSLGRLLDSLAAEGRLVIALSLIHI